MWQAPLVRNETLPQGTVGSTPAPIAKFGSVGECFKPPVLKTEESSAMRLRELESRRFLHSCKGSRNGMAADRNPVVLRSKQVQSLPLAPYFYFA